MCVRLQSSRSNFCLKVIHQIAAQSDFHAGASCRSYSKTSEGERSNISVPGFLTSQSVQILTGVIS
jgi:hypothetical protein